MYKHSFYFFLEGLRSLGSNRRVFRPSKLTAVLKSYLPDVMCLILLLSVVEVEALQDFSEEQNNSGGNKRNDKKEYSIPTCPNAV